MNEYNTLLNALVNLRVSLDDVYQAIEGVEDGEELVTTPSYPFREDLWTAIGETFDWYCEIKNEIDRRESER